jgi:hypothetical protein
VITPPSHLHLEGMGIIGCYLAWRLFADGVPFTWHDTDEPVTAWRASTGAIFPTGHAEDQEALAVWRGHLDDPGFSAYLEEADYVFCTQRPPHEGRYPYRVLAGDVKLATERSLHLNAQQWVPYTRKAFSGVRVTGPPIGARRVITHGFGPRLARLMWGWTVPVRLRTTVELERRPAVYFRRGRFTMAYAYPIPRTELWYAGSSLISQRVPKHLDVRSKYRRWRDTFLELGEGFVLGVSPVGRDAVEGWRPVPAEGDTEWLTEQADGSLAARPLWHSGIRHAPHIYHALQEALHGARH